jgi:hypothetical protein
MQLRRLSAFALYIGSYFPLCLVLLAQDIDFNAAKASLCNPSDWLEPTCGLPLLHPIWSIGAVVISAACLAVTIWTLRVVEVAHRVSIAEAKHIPADLINYIIPYVVSFMGIDFASPSKMVGFGVFFVLIFWITFRSGQIVMNPILAVFGWKLFEIKYSYLQSDDQFAGRVLSKIEIEPNKSYAHGNIQDVMIVRGLQTGE